MDERDEAAVRTAVLLGAEFVECRDGDWRIEGIEHRAKNKHGVAWLFLISHGICISEDGSPVLAKDYVGPPGDRFHTYSLVGSIMGKVYDEHG